MYKEAKDTHCSYLLENKIAHLLGMVLEGKYPSCSGRQDGIFPYLKAIFLPRGWLKLSNCISCILLKVNQIQFQKLQTLYLS